MFRAVVLFCAVLALTKGQTTQVSQCVFPNAGLLPINAYIAGCETQPCSLPVGQDAVIQVVFRAPYVIHRMRTVAWAYLTPLTPIYYPLGARGETCDFFSNTYCPVVRDEVILYTLNMPIEAFMGGNQLPIEFRIQDDNNRNIMCIRVVVSVQAAANKIGTQNSTITVEDEMH